MPVLAGKRPLPIFLELKFPWQTGQRRAATAWDNMAPILRRDGVSGTWGYCRARLTNVKPEQLHLLNSVSAPAIHPDGTKAVVSVTRPDFDADSYVGQLWSVPLDTTKFLDASHAVSGILSGVLTRRPGPCLPSERPRRQTAAVRGGGSWRRAAADHRSARRRGWVRVGT
jgi:hypothetical protein